MKIPRIGRGKNMSIAKAALIVFERHEQTYFYTGDLNIMHEIVDVAGAKQVSFFTAQQVCACLNSSPYWECNFWTKGWCNRRANCYEPSKKGIKYYKKNFEQREAV